MHFNFLSFLLGLLFGIVLICLLIFWLFRASVQDDDRLFRAQKLRDDYDAEHNPIK
jgi:hypothetical protein